MQRLSTLLPLATATLSTALLVACGGGTPFDNPPLVDNPAQTAGRKLSFAYYQQCVHPILLMPLDVLHNGVRTRNTCASSGCHDDTAGTGGALRLRPQAVPIDLRDPAQTPERIRASEMYRNFYSAQGEAIPGQPLASRLIAKPLLMNVLHGGGLVFDRIDDPLVQRIAYWISRPMPEGHDEFRAAADSMFTPADAATGACRAD